MLLLFFFVIKTFEPICQRNELIYENCLWFTSCGVFVDLFLFFIRAYLFVCLSHSVLALLCLQTDFLTSFYLCYWYFGFLFVWFFLVVYHFSFLSFSLLLFLCLVFKQIRFTASLPIAVSQSTWTRFRSTKSA